MNLLRRFGPLRRRLRGPSLAALALAAMPATAQPTPAVRPAEPAAPAVRVHLMEGSVVSGQLSIDALTVETEFGRLQVPVEHVQSFTPGLASHPDLQKRIARLIQQLGSNDAAERDQAQRELTDFGPSIRTQLDAFRSDEDPERRTRVEKIFEELDLLAEDDLAPARSGGPLVAGDTVETDKFTVVGRIAPESFKVETPFGPLTVALKDIRYVARESRKKPEVRARLIVTENEFTNKGMKDTGLRLERGDQVSITASGQLTMTPWGNNNVSTPDGAGNLAWYANGIGAGALVGRVGQRGEEFLVGARHTFTAKTPGTLYLGIGMAAQFAQQGYNFPGQYEARIRVNPAAN